MIPQGIKVVVGDYKTFEFTPDVFGAIVQYPNADGSIEDIKNSSYVPMPVEHVSPLLPT